jgi:hypothetical protein
VGDERGGADAIEEVEERGHACSRRRSGLDDRRDRVHGDALRHPLAEQTGQLIEGDGGIGRAGELAREVELVAEDDEPLVGQRRAEIEAEVVALGEEVGRVIVGEEGSRASLVERGMEELETCDALAGAGGPGQHVGSRRHDPAEALVQWTDPALHQHRHRTIPWQRSTERLTRGRGDGLWTRLQPGSHTYAATVPPHV